jgi:hypothetical protein
MMQQGFRTAHARDLPGSAHARCTAKPSRSALLNFLLKNLAGLAKDERRVTCKVSNSSHARDLPGCANARCTAKPSLASCTVAEAMAQATEASRRQAGHALLNFLLKNLAGLAKGMSVG